MPTSAHKVKKPSPTVPNSLAPLNPIRTETVFSRLPIHNLAKKGKVDIQILQKNERGEIDLRWEVSYNDRFGQPRQLAYKLDTIIVNRKFDELAKPLPHIVCLGSLHTIAEELGLKRDTLSVKKAILQNAASFITAKLRYTGNDGIERTIEAGFSRYSVVFTGERLPDGRKANAVYLVLNDPYREVLNNAPTRPLDYEYLKTLSPSAQRFYEIVSYKIFAAIKYKHARAKLPYSEYCTFSAQQRYYDFDHVKKQMYKVHRPHLASGYLTKASFEATTDSDGKPDWTMSYIPGPKAQTEFKAFNGKHSPSGETLEQESILPLETSEVSVPDEARELVRYFHRRFHRTDIATPTAKDLKFAAELLTQYGMEKARFVVDYSLEAAASTKYAVNMLVGIRQYVEPAIKTFAARAKQRENIRREEATKRQEEELKEQYEHYRDQEIDRIKSTIAPAELAAMESSIRTDLRAKGSVYHTSETMIRIERDKQLASRAGVPTYEEWQEQQRNA